MSLPPSLQETLDDLALLPDRAERIEYLISLADTYKPVSESDIPKPYPESARVPACESEVFVFVGLDDDKHLDLKIAVENPQGMSAMAMAAVLRDALQGQDPALAQSIDEEVVFQLFGRELSMGKSMGLTNLVRMVKSQASKLSS